MRLLLLLGLLLLSVAEAQVCQDGERSACNYPNIGECRSGTQVCEQGQWGICLGGVGPREEVCSDGKDNDCDDLIDEECECRTNESRICGPQQEVGICAYGRQVCQNNAWGPCLNATYAFPNELCGANESGNGLDDNCNGQADEGCRAMNATQVTTCFNGVKDGDETGVDCGGPCVRCQSCSDGIQNQHETGVDCGGPCRSCASCNDGVKNQGEEDADCGGPCMPCASLDESDKDRDGLTYSIELERGTNPDVTDTDGDGVADGRDLAPLCPNMVCDVLYGETKESCPKDCRTTNVAGIVVIGILLLTLFIGGAILYRRRKKGLSKAQETTQRVVPKIDVERYKELEEELSKENKTVVEDKLETSLKKAEKFLKK